MNRIKVFRNVLMLGAFLALSGCGDNVTKIYLPDSGVTSSESRYSDSALSSSSEAPDENRCPNADSSSLVSAACPTLSFVPTEHLNQKRLADCGYDFLLDERDCQVYRTVTIGGQTWMAQNLNYLPKSGDSYCYDGDDSYCEKYGRLYVRAAVSCPSGWHVPDDSEWQTLFASVGGQSKASAALRASSGWEEKHPDLEDEDAYGFSALPSGVYYFGDEGNTGWFFSATDYNDFSVDASESSKKSTAASYTAISVRCVKD